MVSSIKTCKAKLNTIFILSSEPEKIQTKNPIAIIGADNAIEKVIHNK